MNLVIRPIKRNPQEILMGQYIWFYPCDGMEAVSVTANSEGFATQKRVGDFLGFTHHAMVSAANMCNTRYEVTILNKSNPYLLLVPQTKGQKDCRFLIQDLMNACNALKIKTLHFTHYGFVQNGLPEKEVQEIFNLILDSSNNKNLDLMIWDIDLREIDCLKTICKKVKLKIPHLSNRVIWI